MILELAVIGLIMQTALFSWLDWKIWKTYYTPFIFLSLPFVVVLLAGFLLTDILGFYPIQLPVVVIWMVGLFLFWIPSLIFGLITLPKRNIRPFENCKYTIPNDRFVFGLLLFILLIVLMALVISLRSAGLFSEKFSTTIFYSSVLAHLKLFVRVFFIILLGSDYRLFGKTGKITLAILMLMVFALSESKSWLLIPIITVILLKASGTQKIKLISVKTILLGAGMIFGVFYVVYYFTVGKMMDFATYNTFLLTHIGKYFFAPVIALSEYMVDHNDLGINVVYPVISPVNLFNVIAGKEIIPTNSDNWTFFFDDGSSNVYTFFGDIIINSGWIGLITYTLFISSFYHIVLVLSIKKINYFLNSVYFFLVTFLLFGWFGVFTPLLAFYEIPVIFLLFYIISRLRLSIARKTSVLAQPI
jgi:oligosaccharide repeat unit polymerase